MVSSVTTERTMVSGTVVREEGRLEEEALPGALDRAIFNLPPPSNHFRKLDAVAPESVLRVPLVAFQALSGPGKRAHRPGKLLGRVDRQAAPGGAHDRGGGHGQLFHPDGQEILDRLGADQLAGVEGGDGGGPHLASLLVVGLGGDPY